jgi:hypothetical protein
MRQEVLDSNWYEPKLHVFISIPDRCHELITVGDVVLNASDACVQTLKYAWRNSKHTKSNLQRRIVFCTQPVANLLMRRHGSSESV